MKVALVTGAAQRIGRSFAMFLAERGYAIALHYNRSREAAEETCREIRGKSADCECFAANLSEAADVDRLIPKVLQSMGSVDLLINNASVFNHSLDLMRTTVSEFDHDMRINLRTPFFLMQAFAKQINERKAPKDSDPLIVNMLDTRITKIDTKSSVYALSKQALSHLTLVAAKSLAPTIRVNALAPGPALPPPDAGPEHLDAVVRKTPLGIPSPPASLVAGLGYLLDARTVTGQTLFIDSGQHL